MLPAPRLGTNLSKTFGYLHSLVSKRLFIVFAVPLKKRTTTFSWGFVLLRFFRVTVRQSPVFFPMVPSLIMLHFI